MFLEEGTKRRLLQMAPGLRAEHAIYYLLAPHLLGFWTFLKPGHAGREIGDVLFTFGDVCILFEAKTRDKAGPASRPWTRSRLREAVGQLGENYRRLSAGDVPVLRNPWRGEIEWGSLGIKFYHGIIVLMHESDPYDPRDLDSSILESGPIPFHVISLVDLEQLIRLVNTPWDFVVYWEFRHLIGRTYAIPVHEERNIYWTILKNWSELAQAQGGSHSDRELAEDRDFMVDYTRVVMRAENAKYEMQQATAASYLIDIAAGSIMRKAEPDETGKRVGSDEHRTVVRTVQLIAELSRRRRAAYGNLWVNLARTCRKTNEQAWGHGYSPTRHQSYVFHVRPTLALEADQLVLKSRERMSIDKSNSVVVLSATARNILQTYEDLLSTVQGEGTKETDEDILNTTSVLVEKA